MMVGIKEAIFYGERRKNRIIVGAELIVFDSFKDTFYDVRPTF